jgi:pyruvate,orthophosphate dikinase
VDHSKQQRGPGVVLDSEALRRNLAETAVQQVIIDPRYRVLQEVVERYRGLRNTIDALLFELHHPYRNWQSILPELRSFALKNLGTYVRHPKGAQAVALIIDVFLDALTGSKRRAIQATAVDGLMAYLEKVAQASLAEIHGLPDVLDRAFEKLLGMPDSKLRLLTHSYHPLKRIGRDLLSLPAGPFHFTNFNRLLVRALRLTFRYWLEEEEDPMTWFQREIGRGPPQGDLYGAFMALSHARFREGLQFVDRVEDRFAERRVTEELLALPGHLDIVRMNREIPQRLADASAAEPEGPGRTDLPADGKVLYLFKIMETAGLAEIHEETLRELQRSITEMIRREPPERLEAFILRTFVLLRQQVVVFPRTALQCIQSIGHEVFAKGSGRLVEMFLKHVVEFGFQTPEVSGVDTEWQLLGNPAHLLNVRVWLDLISLNPKWCTTLLSALMINLKLAGTCIRDTDLFQKDLSKLLNSEIEPVYNPVKQLTKLLPVFFNEIGAEGLLRDVSTDLDEIRLRRDPLIHFLRKQSHVESSNLIVDFVEEILQFWLTQDPTGLHRFLPAEVYAQISPSGPFIDEPHRILQALAGQVDITSVKDLLNVPEEHLANWISGVEAVSEEERRRVLLLCRMYRLVYQKYHLGFQEIRYHLAQAKAHGFPGLDRLQEVLDGGDPEACLEALLDYLELLKQIVLSEDTYEATEDIYHKRHIAADIPSVYGRYHERKFDALGLSFRLENLANVYFEQVIDSINLSLITRATFFRIIRYIRLFMRAMQVDGVSSQRLETHLKLLEKSLEVRRFSYTQYLDILRGLSEGVKDILSVYYTDVHKDNLTLIIDQLGREKVLPTFLGRDNEEDAHAFVHRVSERFLRDLIASTFGLQYLDNFLAEIHRTLATQRETLSESDLELLLTYDPEKVVCPIHRPHRFTNDLIHLGAKGYNLVVLPSEGMPVPPGFIVTTEVFRCHQIVRDFPAAHRDFQQQIRAQMHQLEQETGRKYGAARYPLLVSVRSGATISMPGMMDTLLNVGMNEEIAAGYAEATRNPWFAWDNYRRFLQSWGMSFGVEREVFNDLINTWKAKCGVAKKREFSGEQMCELALAYRQAVLDCEIEIADEPWEQLETAVHQVIYSWNSSKARDYREIMGISEDWGTAVIVQVMVFGNKGPHSGSGVLFTANPMQRIRRVVPWGDFTPMNQGEDIVAGLVSTYPISNEQRRLSARLDEPSLEEQFPEIYAYLKEISEALIYDRRWNPQEIEFTFEGPARAQLFMLQTRDMVTARRTGSIPVFAHGSQMIEHFLGKGTGVSGAALAGRAVFTVEDIQRLRREDPEAPLILIRSDTVPDDIRAISMSDGLLTAKGGQTSHAAIVALRLGKTCVVGCGGLKLLSDGGPGRIHDRDIRCGDEISLDGREGSVYLGRHPIEQKAIR